MSSFLPSDCRRIRTSGANVTSALMGDPPPWRAGRAPDCEDSRRDEALRELRRELGLADTGSERALLREAEKCMSLMADRERLAPRRYARRTA